MLQPPAGHNPRPPGPGPWLTLILLAASVFRFAGLHWDRGQNLHPDERFLVFTVQAVQWPESVTAYFDEARSPLNPRNAGSPFFAYGSLPVVAVKAISSLAQRHDWNFVTDAGRTLSAWLDLLTVALVYGLARALRLGRRTGLFAAAFYAASVCAIQQAHFFVVDPAVNFFLACALLFLARSRYGGGYRDCAAAGASLGLALACKVSAAALLPVALLVFVEGALSAPRSGRRRALGRALAAFVLFTLAAAAVFRVAEPAAFRGPGPWNPVPSARWMANLAESARLASGETDTPPGHQWTGRTRLLFPWVNMVAFGMGVPLGLAAWAGFAAGAARLLRGRSRRLLLPVAWSGLVFFFQGSQWAATLRYFLPIYGCLCVLAAWVLVRAPRLGWRGTRRLAPATALLTLLWAGAFTSVYLLPHTRIEASEWMYRHLAPGQAVAVEHWDDPLPLRLPGRTPQSYAQVQMRWYDAETPAQLERALGWLDRSDWIVLSSNRLSDSIPRLPARYPIATRYYRALADGSLGFEKAREFRSWLGEAGEEAFSVYDHPVVRIYRKTPGYSRERAAERLGAVNWQEVLALPARQLSPAPTGLMLPEGSRAREAASPAWDSLFPADGAGRRFPLATFLAALFVLGWVAVPYLFVACPGLADRGYGFAKTLGVLLTAWLAWLGAALGLVRFDRFWIEAAVLTVLAGAVAIAAVRRREMRAWLAERWKLLLAADAVFLAAFALMAAARWGHTDLWHPFFGGEKPMDLAYLNAAVRTEGFPIANPWFAGGFINYYYFGFVLAAALLKGCGIPPDIGYNLVLPGLYALAAAGLYSLGHSLLGPGWRPRARAVLALLAPLLVMAAGNLKQIALLARQWGGQAAPPSALYFDASRAIRAASGEAPPITEFPFFTFLYGDLHAHAMALPVFVLALGMAVSLMAAPAASMARWAALALASLAAGALWASNTWDLPVAALLLGAALCAGGVHRRRALLEWAAMLAAAWLAFHPFHRWFAPGYGAPGFWHGSLTPASDYLVVHGIFLAALAPALAASWRLRPRTLAAAAVALAAWTALGGPAWPVAAVLAWLACGWRPGPCQRFVAWLAAAGLILTLAVEFVVLRGDAGRMNTVFKFGFQAWTLLGVAAAASFPCWFQAASGRARRAVAGGLAILTLAGLAYPFTAPGRRARDRFDPSLAPSWDGTRFLATARHAECGRTFPLAGDREAIGWLRANAGGAAAIAESPGGAAGYGWGGRISVYTGLPAIVGWSGHVRQQMGPFDAGRTALRVADVREIYDTPDSARAVELLRKYDAALVVAGALEHACHAPAGMAKFARDPGWETVFQAGETRIFRAPAGPRAAVAETVLKR